METTWENMIEALGKKPTKNIVAMTVTITPGLEARIMTLLPVLPHLINREAAGMKMHPLHLPKE